MIIDNKWLSGFYKIGGGFSVKDDVLTSNGSSTQQNFMCYPFPLYKGSIVEVEFDSRVVISGSRACVKIESTSNQAGTLNLKEYNFVNITSKDLKRYKVVAIIPPNEEQLWCRVSIGFRQGDIGQATFKNLKINVTPIQGIQPNLIACGSIKKDTSETLTIDNSYVNYGINKIEMAGNGIKVFLDANLRNERKPIVMVTLNSENGFYFPKVLYTAGGDNGYFHVRFTDGTKDVTPTGKEFSFNFMAYL